MSLRLHERSGDLRKSRSDLVDSRVLVFLLLMFELFGRYIVSSGSGAISLVQTSREPVTISLVIIRASVYLC